MNCKRAEDLILSEYAEGILKGSSLEELEGHLNKCLLCRKLAEEVVRAGAALRSSGRQNPPDAVWQKVQVSLAARPGIRDAAADFIETIRYGLYRLKPAVVATATIMVLLFAFAAARMISDENYYTALSARHEIMGIISLNGDNGLDKYDIGTYTETFFL